MLDSAHDNGIFYSALAGIVLGGVLCLFIDFHPEKPTSIEATVGTTSEGTTTISQRFGHNAPTYSLDTSTYGPCNKCLEPWEPTKIDYAEIAQELQR
ncbi:hypothetical protein KY335_05350 [Candidatus Woesearchaeota archaeon]|nr:hypothetical protein [Candidatus Woesearchaeota archaeon]